MYGDIISYSKYNHLPYLFNFFLGRLTVPDGPQNCYGAEMTLNF